MVAGHLMAKKNIMRLIAMAHILLYNATGFRIMLKMAFNNYNIEITLIFRLSFQIFCQLLKFSRYIRIKIVL